VPIAEETVSVLGYGEIAVRKDDEVDEIALTLVPRDRILSSKSVEFVLDDEEVDELIEALPRVMQAKPSVTVTSSPVTPTPVSSTAVAESQAEAYIKAKVPMVIDYVKENGDQVQRIVSPYEIREIADSLPFVPPKYVSGWDHTAGGYRNFRISRIKGVAPAPVEYRRPE